MSQQLLDDPLIVDDDNVWRRIHPKQIVRDSNSVTGYRITSAAFSDSPDGSPMSGFWEKLHRKLNLNESDALRNHEGFSLASFQAGIARSLGQGIQQDPVEEAPAHVLVFGDKSKSTKRQLAAASRWIVFSPPVS